MSFRLLEPVRNTVASERNPHRDGWYLRTVTRQGGMNPGRWAVVVHDDGTESNTPPGNLMSLGCSLLDASRQEEKRDTHTCLTCVNWGTSMREYPCLECGQHYDRSDLWEPVEGGSDA